MAEIVISGVHFNVDLCREMSEKAFVSTMGKVHFLDKTEKERKTILRDAYKMIAGTANNVVETSDPAGADEEES